MAQPQAAEVVPERPPPRVGPQAARTPRVRASGVVAVPRPAEGPGPEAEPRRVAEVVRLRAAGVAARSARRTGWRRRTAAGRRARPPEGSAQAGWDRRPRSGVGRRSSGVRRGRPQSVRRSRRPRAAEVAEAAEAAEVAEVGLLRRRTRGLLRARGMDPDGRSGRTFQVSDGRRSIRRVNTPSTSSPSASPIIAKSM